MDITLTLANRIASYGFKKGLEKIFNSQSKFEKELYVIINKAIEEYKVKNPCLDGTSRFYDSQIFIEELLKYRLFSSEDFTLDVGKIRKEIAKHSNFIIPKAKDLNQFIEIFDKLIKENNLLKSLEITAFKGDIMSSIFSRLDAMEKMVIEIKEQFKDNNFLPKSFLDTLPQLKRKIYLQAKKEWDTGRIGSTINASNIYSKELLEIYLDIMTFSDEECSNNKLKYKEQLESILKYPFTKIPLDSGRLDTIIAGGEHSNIIDECIINEVKKRADKKYFKEWIGKWNSPELDLTSI